VRYIVERTMNYLSRTALQYVNRAAIGWVCKILYVDHALTSAACPRSVGYRHPGRTACNFDAPPQKKSGSAPEEDHHRVIATALRPPPDWRRPPGRPRSTWLRVIDEDVQPQNFGVPTSWRKAKDSDTWHQVVSTATLC